MPGLIAMIGDSKKDMRGLVIGAAVLAMVTSAPTMAAASNWVHAGRVKMPGSPGVTIYVDMDSMRRAGSDRLRTWIKYKYDRPQRDSTSEVLSDETIDCNAEQHSTAMLMSYDRTGNVIRSQPSEANTFDPIVPDSLLAGMLPFTCAAAGLRAR